MVKNQETKQREQRSLGDCWQCKANGQCSKGDNCSFRHDKDKRAKSTQPNPSPSSFYAAECEKCIENQESQRQWENGSTAVQGLPQRNLQQLHSVRNGTLRSGCSTRQRKDANLGISALTDTASLTNSLAKSLKQMVTKLQWLC